MHACMDYTCVVGVYACVRVCVHVSFRKVYKCESAWLLAWHIKMTLPLLLPSSRTLSLFPPPSFDAHTHSYLT